MISAGVIENLSNKIREIVDSSPAGDLDKNIHALIQGAFTKMELVSREEFDVQSAVLKTTREQLNQCQERMTELESLLKEK